MVGDNHCSKTKWIAGTESSEKSEEREKDPMARLRAIKAYSNHHYIITEFLHQSKLNEESRQFDPMRKSLILARYCKFLSHICIQYSREYLEISKVNKTCSMKY